MGGTEVSQPHYNPEDPKIKKATRRILKVIRPGDVVNQKNTFPRWQIWMILPVRAIRRYQKKLFGKCSRYQDDHTMLFFDHHKTLSVEPPRALSLWKVTAAPRFPYTVCVTMYSLKPISK